MLAVTFAVSTWLVSSRLAAQVALPQYGHKAVIDKGPRALGLLQLSPKGKKGRLTPIVIMMDGKFYDAGSYKAAPVPMALDFDTVYEGFRTGVSQGIFTITQPGQLNHEWIAEGTWLPAGEKAAEKSKKYSTPVIEDKDAPPVLHRHSDSSEADKKDQDKGKSKDDKDQDKDKGKEQSKPGNSPAPTAAPSAPGAQSPPDATKAPSPPEPANAAQAKEPVSDETIADPNRPRLRRGKPDSTAHREPFTTFGALTDDASGTGKPGASAKDPATLEPPGVFIPVISDAGGPDPRPYTYEVKPAEEAIYRNKMFALAAAQLRPQVSGAAKELTTVPKKAIAGKSPSKPPKADFDDVSLRIFDLSNSNEPILVLSAKTRPSAGAGVGSGVASGVGSNDSFEPKEITLIARTNLEGELNKLFFSQTDSRHLDATPRMELIDAVDADGDGRGELLFRRTYDDGSAYAIYRVTADRLWPLFEGTP
jgi:hypothetical protein